ncbi:hypothetical protein [Neisseria sp. CCUG12390]|uniref:hypothetical protein n=1 Tax=Neisseria sp. CCUG12390 TaxID=3392035 RepID=UPI003A100DE2
MLWELIATVSAGFGAAGIALIVRTVFKKLPKWMIPAAAGLGMIGFQVFSEYTWFEHTRSRLPSETAVVAEIPETAFYKPWSYIRPQVLKFVAVDTANIETVDKERNIRRANLYFFERRMSAQTLPVWIDCGNGLQTDIADPSAQVWGKTEHTANIVAAVCR